MHNQASTNIIYRHQEFGWLGHFWPAYLSFNSVLLPSSASSYFNVARMLSPARVHLSLINAVSNSIISKTMVASWALQYWGVTYESLLFFFLLKLTVYLLCLRVFNQKYQRLKRPNVSLFHLLIWLMFHLYLIAYLACMVHTNTCLEYLNCAHCYLVSQAVCWRTLSQWIEY